MGGERLQKLLAEAGLASRRAAEGFLAEGRVRVNGKVATLGQRADPLRDRIELDGRPLVTPVTVHLAVHKPAGYLSSAHAERGRPSVVELVPQSWGRIWPAGRLDLDSEGLMLLTNDGRWAQRITHPRYGLQREYAVLLPQQPSSAARARLLAGVTLSDGAARLDALQAGEPPTEILRPPRESGAWLRATLSEGRKREVRRLFATVGYPVQRLVRVRIGPIGLAGLAPGAWRALEPGEVDVLAGEAPRVELVGEHLSVAVVGPSGSGKSTVGRALAQRLRASFVDTGLLYRALTLAALERGVDPEDGVALGRLAAESGIRIRPPSPDEPGGPERVLIGERDVTLLVRAPRIDREVSAVSRHAEVRDAMLELQRAEARRAPTVMVGRDIGTVVLPHASLKVYLTATAAVRAARRAREMGRPERMEEYLREIAERDAADAGREVAPLRRAPGALVIDTGELDVAASVEAIVRRLQRGAPPGP